jgi:hypothetical protein
MVRRFSYYPALFVWPPRRGGEHEGAFALKYFPLRGVPDAKAAGSAVTPRGGRRQHR